MLTETFNQSINNEQVIMSLETLDGSGTSKHAVSNPEIFDRSESSTSSKRLIDITFGREREDPEVSGSDNSDYPVTHINGTNSMLVPAETSSSSSSSESSSNDFFQARKVRFAESAVSKSASEDEQSDVSRESSVKSEVGQSSPTSPSQVYNSTHGYMGMSPTISPPVQVMDRSSEHDRHRIPSSVFASKTNSMDWSNASNESLFSIQIGNTSLTRDRAFLSPDICKSGELTKSGELNMFHPLPSVLIEDRDTGRKNIELEDSQTTEMSDEDLKLEERLSEKNSHPAGSYELSNVPCLPNGNGNGSHSSASPIKKKCTWRLCYCNNCSWAFCYYKLPSCYLRCPRCCLTCPSCWCCCHASADLTDEERLGSVKTQQQSSNKSSEVTSSSTCNFCNWCQCFSWSCYTCSERDSPRQQSYDKASEKTSSLTCNFCNWCQCFSRSCYTCCSHRDSPRQQSYDKASEKTSSSTCNFCNWCQCFSWSCYTCSKTDSPRQQSYDKASEKTSCSTCNFGNWCQCFSWSCYTCCSKTDSTQQQSYDKASEKTSYSTCNFCNWCQCFSWSCNTCCSKTNSPQQQSYDKASEKTSSSTCNFRNWCQCFSWSCYTCCSQKHSPRQQSFDKASEKTSSSTSNSCTCSWGKCCGCASCCCCCCLLKD